MFSDRPWDKVSLLRLLSGILICIGCTALLSLLLSAVAGSSIITAQQIQDPAALAKRLSSPPKPGDLLGKLLRASLATNELAQLQTSIAKKDPDSKAETTRLLTNVLNRALSGPGLGLGDTNLTAQLTASPETRRQLEAAHTDLQTLRARRLLLEDGLPGLLAPIHHRIELRSADLLFVQFLVSSLAFDIGLLWVLTRFLHEQSLRWGDFLRGANPRPVSALPFAIFAGCAATLMMLGVVAFISLVIEVCEIKQQLQRPLVILQQSDSGLYDVMFALFDVVAAPFFEETLFRGIIYSSLRQWSNRALAGPVSAILFGIIHMDAEKFLPLALFGLVLVYVYEKTGTLLAPMLTHATFNTINFTLFLFHDQLRQ